MLCRACDGYDKSLRRDLKDALSADGLRGRVRVVESSCLDICPKRGTAAVLVLESSREVVVLARDARPGTLRDIVRRFET